MKIYEVTGTKAGFFAGAIVGLTVEQAAPRAHKLQFVEERDGLKVYKVVDHIEFKAGEILGVLTEVTKLQLTELDESSLKLLRKKQEADKKAAKDRATAETAAAPVTLAAPKKKAKPAPAPAQDSAGLPKTEPEAAPAKKAAKKKSGK